VLKERGYRYGKFITPPDVRAKVWGMENSRIQQLIDAGITPDIAPEHYIDDGIEAVAQMLETMSFDAEKCEQWLKCLRNYRRQWDDKRGAYKDEPFHNWASHGSDMTRYGAVAFKAEAAKVEKPKAQPKGIMQMTYNDLGSLNRKRPSNPRI